MNGSRLSSPADLLSLPDAETTIRVPTDGDTHAFALLVERWERPVKLLCARMTGDAHRAEDLAQETFTRLFLHRDRYRGRPRPSTLLWRIAINLCCDERRNSMRRKTVSIDGDPAAADRVMAAHLPPDARLIHRERADLVRNALSRLPSHYRTVLIHRYYDRCRYHEIARILKIPQGTVKSRIASGLSRLARLLKPTAEASYLES